MTTPLLTRRTLIQSAAALAGTSALFGPLGIGSVTAAEALRFGMPQPFSFDWLVTHAKELAQRSYVPPPRPAAEVVQQIDYDAHGKLRFDPEYALWGDGGSAYPITFMHLGRHFPTSVQMFAVENGQAREILYSRHYFRIDPDHPATRIPAEEPAFAGFWLRESRRAGSWQSREPWVTFLGASYFRTIGEYGQVGMSARGIALNVGNSPSTHWSTVRA